MLGGSAAAVSILAGGSLFTGWNGREWRRSSRDHSPITDGPTVGLETVADGLAQPLALETPLDGYVYVADKAGQVYLIAEGELLDDPVLDIADELQREHGEQGLLGLACHPEFENSRKLYVRYSSPPRDGTPDGYSHTFVLSEFVLEENYSDVIAGSERPILEIPEPGRMHNAGGIEFGPDGYLYVTVGDGGGDGHDGSGPLNRGADSHAGDWYLTNVGGNGQDVTRNLLGSVLRIDVNERDDDRPYDVPDDNPLVGEPGLEEHFAWGFRNPYSLWFGDGRLFVADVGTRVFEEVNLVERGGNYGWNVKEGPACHNNAPPLRALSAVDFDVRSLPGCPNATPDGTTLTDPVITYPHLPGGAVVGGTIYENTALPAITNKHVFGDLRGRLFASNPSESDELWEIEALSVTEPSGSGATEQMTSAPLAIETGTDGELFVLTVGREGGKVRRMRPA